MLKIFKVYILSLLGACSIFVVAYGQALTNPPVVHDPVMIKQDSMYYLFCTGMGITRYSSTDMQHWKKELPVFAKSPEWTVAAIPGFKGHIWAPDINFYNGKYYLFYAVSQFGKNTSCIGLATNTTLNDQSPSYRWEDKGMIIQSVPGRDMWNAIDPAFITDENGIPWLCFGSFWEGIKMVRLKKDISAIDEKQQWYTLASRPRTFGIADTTAGDAAIEAPFIFKHDKYYYLFVSYDYCCRGINSTYKVMVGRSEHVTGPYADKNGLLMSQGGSSLVVEGDKHWMGVGHNAAYRFNDKDYIIYHGYSAEKNGISLLITHELSWDEKGWPVIK